MSKYSRENQYVALLAIKPHTVKELSEKLFVSEPTVRRDISELKSREIVTSKNGLVSLKTNAPDQRIPLFIRHLEQNEEKRMIAKKAAELVTDGNVIMLDSSTTAFHILPHLVNFKNILLITNGAKTAIEAASMGIRTITAGGEMAIESFSYIGCDAETTLSKYNADIAFFSCRGVSENGLATDNSVFENNIRRIMIEKSARSYLLCDKSKFGKTYLNTLCKIDELDGMINE